MPLASSTERPGTSPKFAVKLPSGAVNTPDSYVPAGCSVVVGVSGAAGSVEGGVAADVSGDAAPTATMLDMTATTVMVR